MESPRLSRLQPELVARGREIEPLSVALIASGRVSALAEPESVVALEAGALILCRGLRSIRLVARANSGAEVLLLECPLRWLERAMDLARASRVPSGIDSIWLSANSSDAVTLGRELRHAWMQSELESAPRHALHGTARWLEIAGVALSAHGQPLDCDAVVSELPAPRGSSHAVLPALVALIENREGIPPSLPALAEQLDLSARQTSRLFGQQMGLSFREYVARLRVERATKLLAETRRPVTEIALSSGWNSPSQFNFAFRKQTGMTPGAYRLGRQKERENSIENE